MQSVTPLANSRTQTGYDEEEDSSPGSFSPLVGALAGFCFYWLAFSLPFVFYGLNSTLLLMLYTWPFFLALMPLSVLIGMLFRVLLPHHVVWMMVCCAVTIPGVFWLVFLLITGW
ncbi:DUF3561 family protein [Dickeya sp. CFBP 2040]|uniref:DUF3561 family protein n=1 Tax=Dickeya poaceiphila TaxID=568768 RepID=A0A5B8HTR0_9GAMM|nr:MULTISPECIES: DUF3561 family protein [Dickeya]NKI75089.1 DUF3561 family protein [Dickeya sp. CFBP 2040]QDX31909.1 DUF3561 family protein [Dickeya poaceiphila]